MLLYSVLNMALIASMTHGLCATQKDAQSNQHTFLFDNDLYGVEEYVTKGQDKDSIFISLGYRCLPAAQLRKLGLSSAAYPFDWIVVNFASLITILDNNFEGFLAPENLVVKDMSMGLLSCGTMVPQYYQHILETKYGIVFRHDFTPDENFMNDYDVIKEKYDRRIKRFYKAIASGKHIFFIRRLITRAQAQELTALLDRKFPNLDYTLLAIDYSDEILEDWQLPRVLNFHFGYPEEGWVKLLEDEEGHFIRMFQSLGYLN